MGQYANTASVTCASAGNCAAGGWYSDKNGHKGAFVSNEKSGVWKKAIEVPRLDAVAFGNAQVSSVSCGAVGSCSAGGFYTDRDGYRQAFVVSEKNWAWGNALDVSLPNPGISQVMSVSCRGVGNCSAGGSDGGRAFVVTEKNGVWGSAIEVPGTAALNVHGGAETDAVACVSAGNCAAGGYYLDGSFHDQAFVANEKNGAWGKAVEIPGTAALNVGGVAQVASVSCASVGNCSAGGNYGDGSFHTQAFIVSETKGVWGKAVEVKGSAARNVGGSAQVLSVSCTSSTTATNCSAGGYFSVAAGQLQAFVLGGKNGTWGSLKALPLVGSSVQSVSCISAGNCAAVGNYSPGMSFSKAFVVAEKNGAWGTPVQVPGISALSHDDAYGASVSCTGLSRCALGGSYRDLSGHLTAFVTSP